MDRVSRYGLGLLLAGGALLLGYFSSRKLGRVFLPPGAAIPIVLFRRHPGKELLYPVARGVGRRGGEVQWRLQNIDREPKNVELGRFVPGNPFETTPSSRVGGSDSTPMSAMVRRDAERGLYHYTVFVDGHPGKDPEIMIET